MDSSPFGLLDTSLVISVPELLRGSGEAADHQRQQLRDGLSMLADSISFGDAFESGIVKRKDVVMQQLKAFRAMTWMDGVSSFVIHCRLKCRYGSYA